MFKRLEIKKFFAFLMVACMLAVGVAALPVTAYAEPAEDPAVTEDVTESSTPDAPAQSQEALGITVDAAEDDEEGENPMDTILGFDTIIKEIWRKICSRLLIVLSILVACLVGILIYIMVTQTTKVAKQNKEMERRPERQFASSQPASQGEGSVRQVKQFGDTLRISRTVSQNGMSAQQAPSNMQRPVAPQRPSRPTQGTTQPGVRRPVQGQPVRPVQGQPARSAQSRPARSTQGQPQRRPVQGQPTRPARPVQSKNPEQK